MMVSWPHFDFGSILQTIAGAIVGFVGALWRQNRPKG